MTENRFCCYGTYNPRLERCLVKCPDSCFCKLEKYHEEILTKTKEEKEDEKQNK